MKTMFVFCILLITLNGGWARTVNDLNDSASTTLSPSEGSEMKENPLTPEVSELTRATTCKHPCKKGYQCATWCTAKCKKNEEICSLNKFLGGVTTVGVNPRIECCPPEVMCASSEYQCRDGLCYIID